MNKKEMYFPVNLSTHRIIRSIDRANCIYANSFGGRLSRSSLLDHIISATSAAATTATLTVAWTSLIAIAIATTTATMISAAKASTSKATRIEAHNHPSASQSLDPADVHVVNHKNILQQAYL